MFQEQDLMPAQEHIFHYTIAALPAVVARDLEETRSFLDQLPRPGLRNRPLPLQPGLQGLHRPLQLCLRLPCQDLHPPHPHGHEVGLH